MKFGFLLACFLLTASTTSVCAQPVPTVTIPAPLSIQRGQSAELALSGSALANVSSIVLPENSGLIATLIKSEKPVDTEAKIKLTAGPDIQPGMREARLVSPTGVSNPIPIWVEQYPLATDTEANNSPDAAQRVSLPVIITGTISAAGDSDFYRVVALKGQRLVFNVTAARNRSPLDANLLLYDGLSGRELMSNNDTFGADPFLAFEVPADGEYVLEIRDLQYRGSADYAYRIEAGAIPFIQSLSPMSSRRGGPVELKASGFNLGGTETIRVDLTHVRPGRIPIRIKTSAGFSNEIPFEVTDLNQTSEIEPNDDTKTATPILDGSDISGVIGKPNDVDFFRFKLDKPTRMLVEAYARRIGSPLDAIVTLHDAAGATLVTNDDAAGADARLTRDLPAGEFLLSIRDLGYAGTPAHAYRLSVQPTLANADAPPQNFALTFQPDTPRIHRGGNLKLWCDVSRLNFPADVSIAVEGLPPGVRVSSPTVFPAVSSGILMLAAAADAPLGTYPITFKATAPLGNELVTRVGEPAAGSRIVQQAYLTVLEPAPVSVQPVATLPAERVQQLSAEIAALSEKVLAPSSEIDARQAEWEKKVIANPGWVTLDPESLGSQAKATLTKDADGSVLASGREGKTETYTITAATELKGIVAIKLECLPHPSLPKGGPGRAVNGNFVLNRFAATIAPKSNPPAAKPITFSTAKAAFSQGGYEIAGAIDDNATTGWAVYPEIGKDQTATFLTKEPIGDGTPSVMVITMDQSYGSNHVIGRFRLSVSTDPAAIDAVPVPVAVMQLVKVPADQRTPEQKATLGVYYRSIDPRVKEDIVRLEALRFLLAPQAEMTRLDAALNAQSPQLDAEQAQWEQSLLTGLAWMPLDTSDLRSAAGANLAKEADGSVLVFGASPPTDTYTITAPTTLKNLTGLRIEALPDPRLPGNGPGRAKSGNFVLSGMKVAIAPTATPATTQPVEIASSNASFQQDKYPFAAALDDKPESGWAIGPMMGYPSSAELFFKTPQGADGGSIFTITLEQLASSIPQHTLGRFRFSVTSAPSTDASVRLPANILATLKTPAAQRNEVQKNEIASYHRRIARSLQPVRQRLTEFRSVLPAYPPVVRRGQQSYLPVAISRAAGANAEVQITLEGFSLGRDANGPVSIARSLKLTPLTIAGANVVGAVSFTVEGNAETGTRLVVLRAETKVGNDTIVQYSPAFPLTVN
jgi:hypothetical protein